MASSDHHHLIFYHGRRMEPSCTGLGLVLGNLHFLPAESEEVEQPQIIEIGDSLTPKHDQIGEAKLSRVIGPFPRSWFVLPWLNFKPFLGLPVEDAERVEPLLAGASAAKDDDSS